MPAPAPMPALAPVLSPESVLPPLAPPARVVGEVVEAAMGDVNVLPFDVKTVIELLLASVEVGPDVAVAELATPEELSPALVRIDTEFSDGAASPEARDELGEWPTKNCMLCPVLCGSEHILLSVLESLNATVADAALVQLQNEPGWSVEGSPSCEQMAHSPLLLSQSVRATHGWSEKS